MKKLYLFGCESKSNKGHYWFPWGTDYNIALDLDCNDRLIQCIDATFCPRNTTPHRYRAVLAGHIMIVAWWDYTGDERPGSNIALIGVGYVHPDELIDDAIIKFPGIMNRQPRPTPAKP